MATLSQLVSAIATVEGIDAERVAAIGRAVREHGLIRTSGRGTSAAQMDERDAANLLIAANMADTARTAPDAVQQFRALHAKGKRTSQFGSELEALISAAKQECLADHLTKTVTLLGTVTDNPGERSYPNAGYRISIVFQKPMLSVTLTILIKDGPSGFVEFLDRGPRTKQFTGDRRLRIGIGERSILAVANALRT
ncbi:hypothetical protein [Bradyrhizobium cenepequi]